MRWTLSQVSLQNDPDLGKVHSGQNDPDLGKVHSGQDVRQDGGL